MYAPHPLLHQSHLDTALMSAWSISIWPRSEGRDIDGRIMIQHHSPRLPTDQCANLFTTSLAVVRPARGSCGGRCALTTLHALNGWVMLAARIRNLGQVSSATNPEAWKALATAGRTSPALTDPVDDTTQAKSTSTVRIRVLCALQGQNSEQLP
ncbi:hypothetical protein M436DRAFT_63059 [Aureobasidium namibiae CBS 147.97]|uniref:Uncharacterized protein n=1 Tax=Aureobasidium namibiae CBS 147.97 TaxID=1043004 RepID=A0A074XGH9_9PEZI|nr:uncharacterized protein M436DRAFT_63059 [Aureobasidium namibiae CBS 147.97]KEQ73686.1 hypothetical protein M436DRAFT_63059 [Aureobasidium namibiae CBS 147.97]